MEKNSTKRYGVTQERLKIKLETLKNIVEVFNSNKNDFEKVQYFYNFYTTAENFRKEYSAINKRGQQDPEFSEYIKYFDDIYNACVEYEKKGLFKEAKFIKSVEKYINNYEEAELTMLSYLNCDPFTNHKTMVREIGVDQNVFDNYLTSIKVLNPKLYENYKNKRVENSKIRYHKKLYDCISIANGIKTGYLLDNTPFDILEFWKRAPFKEGTGTKVEFNEYNKLNESIVWGSNFVRRIDNFTKYTIPEANQTILEYINKNHIQKASYLDNKMINYLLNTDTKFEKFITDKNGKIIITDTIIITKEEYSDMFNYILENGYPLTKEVLNIIKNKYLNQEIELKKSNQDETKKLCLKKTEKMSEF